MAVRLSRTFVLRKLHQLSGIVPLGAFLLEHLYTNSKAAHPERGVADFNQAVADLQAIPYVLFIEIGFIFIPLLITRCRVVHHVGDRPNTLSYLPAQLVYTIQRIRDDLFYSSSYMLNFRFGRIPG